MIHYHGTPIGGKKQEAHLFLGGRHALIPYPSQDDLPIAAEVCQSFVFDNGAFSYWKQGGELDVDGYVKWCLEWHRHPGFDWAIIPDVIDGDEDDNNALVRAWMPRIRGVPVWHLHESPSRLAWLANTGDIVAIGSSGQYAKPGTQDWWERIAEAMDAVCDKHGRPSCRLHGLRMLDPDIFRYLPLHSADSVNASMNSGSLARFGNYKPPKAAQRSSVIADRIESHNSAATWTGQSQEDMFL